MPPLHDETPPRGDGDGALVSVLGTDVSRAPVCRLQRRRCNRGRDGRVSGREGSPSQAKIKRRGTVGACP
jgi:hypothetical protein